MFKKVNLLKYNFSFINRNFTLGAIKSRLNPTSIELRPNYDFFSISNYPFYNKLTIKTFTKKANKRKGEEMKDNKKNTNKKIIENKEKVANADKNKTQEADLEDETNSKENNKNHLRPDGKDFNKAKNEELNNEKKTANKANFKSGNEEILKCMIIHPVFSDSKGKNIELYLAEEAIGLGKSMEWEIVPGPFNKKEDFGEANPYSLDQEEAQKGLEHNKNKYRKYKSFLEKPENGDYVQLGEMKGVFFRNGILASVSDDESDSPLDEWKNLNIREEMALSSICSVSNIKSSTFFTKGRLSEIGNYLRQVEVDVLYVNTSLSVIQRRNLEITFNNYLNEENDRIRAYNIKSALKHEGDATETESNFSTVEASSVLRNEIRKIQVLDRFNIILSIFARRAKSKISQIQIELAYLKYTKAKLNRGGHADFSGIYNEFKGNIYGNMHTLDFEVVSGKQSAGRGSLGGSGETQLELDKRKVATRETLLRDELKKFEEKRKVEREARRNNSLTTPTIGLVGYTNAGKTALMNILSRKDFESENKLFQTLNTAIKKTFLPNNQEVAIVDTIGFITDLPHELVDSFKSTLEEVFHSDILIHVVDVSNPSFQFQRKVVYKVLDDIFPKEKSNQEYQTKIIEVWNKIDLIKDMSIINDFVSDNNFPIVPISAKKQMNLDNLYLEIGSKINALTGKELKELRFKMDKYDKIMQWVKDNVGRPLENLYDEETEEMVLKVYMNKDQHDIFMENFIIMRENKKRRDETFINKRLGKER